jgi:hypothetical protein
VIQVDYESSLSRPLTEGAFCLRRLLQSASFIKSRASLFHLPLFFHLRVLVVELAQLQEFVLQRP